MKMTTIIYHNPRCSKSRAVLKLLQEHHVEATVIRYLDTPPDANRLREIVAMLGCSVRDIIRRGETIYRELGVADKSLSEDALLDIVVANPKLLERPIVVRGDRAVVGRPPENVLALL